MLAEFVQVDSDLAKFRLKFVEWNRKVLLYPVTLLVNAEINDELQKTWLIWCFLLNLNKCCLGMKRKSSIFFIR